MNEIIAKLSKAFESPLPGWDAQKRLINYDRPPIDNIESFDPTARHSAVLVLLYPKNGELNTVLILRNIYVGTHSGQVSFPGGKREEEDESLWHTALREAHEEVGIDVEKVKLIGELTRVYIPPSRFLVTPFLAYAEEAPNFQRDRIEVRRVIETPVSAFLDADSILEKMMFVESMNTEIPVKFFDVNGEVVWGATAMILSEMAEILNQSDYRKK